MRICCQKNVSNDLTRINYEGGFESWWSPWNTSEQRDETKKHESDLHHQSRLTFDDTKIMFVCVCVVPFTNKTQSTNLYHKYDDN